jgi:hypothetical protein
MESNPIRPNHYNGGAYEAINVIEAWGSDFCLGNALKYICRAGKKDGNDTEQDLRKAIWYLERKIEMLKKQKQEAEPTRLATTINSYGLL